MLAGAALALPTALLPAAASAQSVAYTLYPTDDTYMRSNQTTQKNGTATSLSLEATKRQILAQFDLSPVPAGHYIVSATLRFYVTAAATDGTVNAHRTTAAWTEATADWATMAANYDSAIVGSAVPGTASAFMDIDVTSLVRAWRAGTANYGFMLTVTGGGSTTQYASRETAGTAQDPQLVVVANGYPSYSMSKLSQVISDPANGLTQPKRMPGAVIEYSATVSSTNSNSSDSNSISLIEAVPAQAMLYVGDIGGAGSGPVSFSNGSPTSGLTYTYSSLANGTDDLSFSTDGSNFTYVPVPDANGFDSAVTHLRIAPKGVFAGNTGSGNPSFTYLFRAKNK